MWRESRVSTDVDVIVSVFCVYHIYIDIYVYGIEVLTLYVFEFYISKHRPFAGSSGSVLTTTFPQAVAKPCDQI